MGRRFTVLVQAWPSLAKGPLGHLWEAGLDPLDPMFLANINDPMVRPPDICITFCMEYGTMLLWMPADVGERLLRTCSGVMVEFRL